MKKEENDKIVLDLDKYADSKRLCDLTAEEKVELFKPLNSQIAELLRKNMTKTTNAIVNCRMDTGIRYNAYSVQMNSII